MQTSDVQLDTADGPARAYQATPPGEPLGAVIVIPEAFGVNRHIEDVARRFAAEGYVGLSVDVFHRSGKGVAPYDDFRQAMALSQGLDDDGFLRDLDAAIAHLGADGIPPSKVAVVGFCIGGRFAFLAALRRTLGAAISYYGGGIVDQGAFPALPPLLDEVDQLATPWLGLFGDLDRSIPVEDVESLRAALASARVPVEIVRYAEAGHGFNCDARSTFDAAASEDAFVRATDWLTRQLV
ncbi:MAG TPA: dienelactone hydrolase family protein [Acidimicrobiales bacterium]|nr:dienelactone hydrolase family protein [Acidimicrobiales bacterium]